MPNVRMPDGAVVRFPDDMPSEQIRDLISSKFPDAAPKPSMMESALSPITSYPETYSRMNTEARQQMGSGVEQLGSVPDQPSLGSAALEAAKGAGNVALGAASYTFSPINAALRTFVGKPIEEATGVPKEMTEFATSLAIPIPGYGMTRGAAVTPGGEAMKASKALGIESKIPRIVTSDSIPQKRIGLTISKVPWGGTPVQTAIENASRAVGQKTSEIASQFSRGGEAASRAEAGSGIRRSIENYVGPVTTKRVDTLYDAVDKFVDPNIKTPVSATANAVSDIKARRGEAFLKGAGGAVSRVDGAVGSPDGLTYQGIKTLRTSIGEDIKRGILPSNMSGAELKQIYGALSDDLRLAVDRAGGPQAKTAFERANRYNALVSQRREELTKILGTKSDETIFDTVTRYASAKGGANIDALRKARKAVPPDEWNELASTAASRLGQTVKGSVDSFNPATFLKEYGNLTPAGKKVLFDSAGKGALRQSLDNIEKVSYQLADLGQYANPSGTAQQGIATGLGVLGIAETLMAGGQVPWATLTGLLGVRGVSMLLAKPKSAGAASKWFSAVRDMRVSPNSANRAKLTAASANLANNVREAGAVSNAMRSFQGAVPARSDDEQASP